MAACLEQRADALRLAESRTLPMRPLGRGRPLAFGADGSMNPATATTLEAVFALPAQPDLGALVALCATTSAEDVAARETYLKRFGLAFAFALFTHLLAKGACCARGLLSAHGAAAYGA